MIQTNIQYAGKANIHLRMLFMSKKTNSPARPLRKIEKSIRDRFFIKLFKDLQLTIYAGIQFHTSTHLYAKKIFSHI